MMGNHSIVGGGIDMAFHEMEFSGWKPALTMKRIRRNDQLEEENLKKRGLWLDVIFCG